jgi:bifunctional non-homologous end joining protein LigD
LINLTKAADEASPVVPIYTQCMFPRRMRPIRLSRRFEPFDSDQFIFELKIDGFGALAYIEAGKGELISRNGNVFRGFADLAAWIAEHLRVETAVLDGEIALTGGCCLSKSSRWTWRALSASGRTHRTK